MSLTNLCFSTLQCRLAAQILGLASNIPRIDDSTLRDAGCSASSGLPTCDSCRCSALAHLTPSPGVTFSIHSLSFRRRYSLLCFMTLTFCHFAVSTYSRSAASRLIPHSAASPLISRSTASQSIPRRERTHPLIVRLDFFLSHLGYTVFYYTPRSNQTNILTHLPTRSSHGFLRPALDPPALRPVPGTSSLRSRVAVFPCRYGHATQYSSGFLPCSLDPGCSAHRNVTSQA